MAQWSRIHQPMQEMEGRSLCWEVALEMEMATYSQYSWTEDPSRLQSMMSQRVGHDLATEQQQQQQSQPTSLRVLIEIP